MAVQWKGRTIRFLSAQTISLFGSSLAQYAIIWYITLTTSSGLMLTLATVCGFAPQLLISLFAGVWVDRYNRKWMIQLADAAVAAASLALALLFLSGYKSVWLLFAALLVRSAGTGVQTPAVNALLPQLVPQDRLMRVGGINSTLLSLNNLLSPAVSGALLTLTGMEAVFLLDVVTAVVGIGVTASVSVPPHDRGGLPISSCLEGVRQGFAYLRRNPFVRRLLAFQLAVLFLISPSAFMTPLLVSRTFGPEVWRLTASEMTFSAGAALGGLLIAWWGGFQSRMRTTLLAAALYGALMLCLGAAPTFWLYLGANLLIGVTMPCYNAPVTVALQEKVEPAMQGRVFSFLQIAASCALPLGMVAFGPLADLVPVQTLLIGAGLLVLAVAGRRFSEAD